MTVSILVRPTVRDLLDRSTLRRRAQRLLRALGEADAELTIVLSDDEEVQALNAQWRQIDRPTDVLSFSQREGLPPGLDPRLQPLGDVVISLPTAQRQAEAEGCLPRLWPALGVTEAPAWGLPQEAAFLMLHGVLHLLGHDHEEPDEAAHMQALEAELLPWVLGMKRTLPQLSAEALSPLPLDGP